MADQAVQVTQRAVPMLSYEDVGAAADWLSRVFGFRERGERIANDEGRVTHAELELDGGVVMLGWPGSHYRGPLRHAEQCETARRWLEVPYVVDGVLVYVDNVLEHHRRAAAQGARILAEVEDQPYGQLYRAEDLEGHRWMFLQPRAD